MQAEQLRKPDRRVRPGREWRHCAVTGLTGWGLRDLTANAAAASPSSTAIEQAFARKKTTQTVRVKEAVGRVSEAGSGLGRGWDLWSHGLWI